MTENLPRRGPGSPDGDDHNDYGIRAHDGNPGAGCTEYNVYARSYIDMGESAADYNTNRDYWIQFGSQAVEAHCREQGMIPTFERAGVTLIQPGCGACIGCGPGVCEESDQVTVSAINATTRAAPDRVGSGWPRR